MNRSLEGRDCPVGYRMIDWLKVRNFRCFENLDLRNFPRFNVIVGENASGKTALLESLFFGAGGSPDLAFRLRGWRGAEAVMQVSRTKESYGSFWQELFFEQDSNKRILAEIGGSDGSNYRIEVFYGENESTTLPLNGGAFKESPALRLITFSGKDVSGKPFHIQPDITPIGIAPASTGEGAPVMFFAAGFRPSAGETAQRFSNLRKQYKHQPLVKAISNAFPIIKDLDIEIEAGASYIFADVGRARKQRLGLVSGGLDKLVSILVGIQSSPQGAVLIDEIGDGIHYTKLEILWSLIREFAQDNDTQIFASTHSWECLKAAQPTVQRYAKDFALFRTESDGLRRSVKHFDGKRLLGALKQDGEVR
jgi:AAA15 family ATPase/GTPase